MKNKPLYAVARNNRAAVSPPPDNPAGFPPEAAHLLDNGPPMYVANLGGQLTYANAQYRRLQQLAADKRTGLIAIQNWPAFPLLDIIRDIMAGGQAIQREDVIEHAGKAEYYSSHHYPIRDERGVITAIGGVYQDVTREALAGLETLAARDRFSDIARMVSDCIWETDEAFNLTYVSPRIMDALNVHPRHLQGTSLFTLGRFRQPDYRLAAFVKGEDPASSLPDRDTRTPFREVLFEVTNTDGEIRLFLMSGVPLSGDKAGTFKGFRGTARDITTEASAQRDAERGQRRMADAIEQISEGFILRDSRAQLVLGNSKFREYFSPIAHSLSPKTPFSHVLAAAKNAGLVAAPNDALDRWSAQTGPGCRLAAPLELQLHDKRWIKVTESRSTKGGVVTILSDITQMKQREEALIAAKQVAERASYSKGEFLANMSHELRTPLNATIGFSEIMLEETFGPLGNDRYREYIKDIHDSSQHLLGVINDILDISKSEAGKLYLQEQDVDLLEEIRDTARWFSGKAAEGKIELTLDLPASLPIVWADARKIKQVLLNLTSNAIKFTPAGGTVTLKAERDDASGDIRIAVIDTGIGIADKDMETVFSAFGQVENSMSRRHTGTGLGVPLSRALMEIHGGEFTLKSKPGAGTTALIRLPASRVR